MDPVQPYPNRTVGTLGTDSPTNCTLSFPWQGAMNYGLGGYPGAPGMESGLSSLGHVSQASSLSIDTLSTHCEFGSTGMLHHPSAGITGSQAPPVYGGLSAEQSLEALRLGAADFNLTSNLSPTVLSSTNHGTMLPNDRHDLATEIPIEKSE